MAAETAAAEPGPEGMNGPARGREGPVSPPLPRLEERTPDVLPILSAGLAARERLDMGRV